MIITHPRLPVHIASHCRNGHAIAEFTSHWQLFMSLFVSDNYITTVLLLLCSLEENPFFSVHKTVPCGINTDIDLNFEPEFDEIIKTIDRTEYDIILPVELNLDMLVDKLRVKNVLTPFQHNINSVLDNLDRSKFKTFCQREYRQITSLTDKIKFQGPVKCQELGEFYTAMHEYIPVLNSF